MNVLTIDGSLRELVTTHNLKSAIDELFRGTRFQAAPFKNESEGALHSRRMSRLEDQWHSYISTILQRVGIRRVDDPRIAIASQEDLLANLRSQSVALFVHHKSGFVTAAGIQDTPIGQVVFSPKALGWGLIRPSGNDFVVEKIDFGNSGQVDAIRVPVFCSLTLDVAADAPTRTTMGWGEIQRKHPAESYTHAWNASTIKLSGLRLAG